MGYVENKASCDTQWKKQKQRKRGMAKIYRGNL